MKNDLFRTYYNGKFWYKKLCDTKCYNERNDYTKPVYSLPEDLQWDQWTGLNDVDEKPVFENDLVVNFNKRWDDWQNNSACIEQEGVFKVIFTDDDAGSCGCCYKSFSGIAFMCERNDGERGELDKEMMRVVGNVYENNKLFENWKKEEK